VRQILPERPDDLSGKRDRGLPPSIWALGFVSMLMDISSEMIHSLLPVYLVTALGVSMAMVGLIEGVSEATASIVKVFSGAVSDWLGKRKALTILGYGIAAITKPVFPLAETFGAIFTARFIDRIGKGIRGAPRDALIADLAPPALRGASFGLRQSLDTIGAFIGPLLAILLMWWSANDFAIVFWLAVIPAFLSVFVLFLFVREPERTQPISRVRFPLQWAELKKLSSVYWLVVMISAVFTLARFSEAFLILKAQASGLPLALAPAVLVAMNVVYALAAYPAGVLSDRVNRLQLLSLGFVILIVADLVLAASSGLVAVFIGIALWGLHLGLTQGLLVTLVADTAQEELRGTAFGIFHLVSGVALFAASLLAGGLWELFGPGVTFQAAAGLTALALFGLGLLHWKVPRLGAGHLSGSS
jgi:MFS family permease